MSGLARRFLYGLLGILLLVTTGCDARVTASNALVVEAYFESGEPLGAVRLSRTAPLAAMTDSEPVEAEVRVEVDGLSVMYLPETANPGSFIPSISVEALPGMEVVLEATTPDGQVSAVTIMPPVIAIDSATVLASPAPVRAAVTIDGATTDRWVYTFGVEIHWTSSEVDDGWWVRPLIRPPEGTPDESGNAFVRLSALAPEDEFANPADPSVRYWEGAYAIIVPGSDDPLPSHEIELVLLRGGLDYAQFLQSAAGGSGNPIGNVKGGLGIVAGLSIDRVTRVVAE